jgi:predicted GNAT family acetyltransferase
MGSKAGADDDDQLDEALVETFPASDAPANTVVIGVQAGESSTSSPPSVSDNPALHRFELTVDGQTAVLEYERTGDALALVHTEVPEALRGRHLGDALVEYALDAAHAAGLRIVPICPFVRAYLRKHRRAV